MPKLQLVVTLAIHSDTGNKLSYQHPEYWSLLKSNAFTWTKVTKVIVADFGTLALLTFSFEGWRNYESCYDEHVRQFHVENVSSAGDELVPPWTVENICRFLKTYLGSFEEGFQCQEDHNTTVTTVDFFLGKRAKRSTAHVHKGDKLTNSYAIVLVERCSWSHSFILSVMLVKCMWMGPRATWPPSHAKLKWDQIPYIIIQDTFRQTKVQHLRFLFVVRSGLTLLSCHRWTDGVPLQLIDGGGKCLQMLQSASFSFNADESPLQGHSDNRTICFATTRSTRTETPTRKCKEISIVHLHLMCNQSHEIPLLSNLGIWRGRWGNKRTSAEEELCHRISLRKLRRTTWQIVPFWERLKRECLNTARSERIWRDAFNTARRIGKGSKEPSNKNNLKMTWTATIDMGKRWRAIIVINWDPQPIFVRDVQIIAVMGWMRSDASSRGLHEFMKFHEDRFCNIISRKLAATVEQNRTKTHLN